MEAKLTDRYGSREGAAAYRRKYERSWIRRLSNRRELALVRRALRRAGTTGRVLDCPCGAGRLVPTLLRVATHVTAVDLSAAMVAEARDALRAEAERVSFAVSGVDALPFEDAAFDTAVCHRLIHHMGDPQERAAVFRELARVVTGHVVLSFSDETTWKAQNQRRRGVERSRYALTPTGLTTETAVHGLVPVGEPMRLNPLSSLLAVWLFRKGA